MEMQSETPETVITDPTPFEQLVANMFCFIIVNSENVELVQSFITVLRETGYAYRCFRIKRKLDIKQCETSYLPTPDEFKILEKISEIVTDMKDIEIQNLFFIGLGEVCGKATREVFEKLFKNGTPLYTTAKTPFERMLTNLTFTTIDLSKETTKQFMGIVDSYDDKMIGNVSKNIYQAYNTKDLTDENNREFPGEKELQLIKDLNELGKNSGNYLFTSTLLIGLWDVYGSEGSRQILFTFYPDMKAEIEQVSGENIEQII